MEGVPGLPPAGSTQCKEKADSIKLAEELKRIRYTLEQTEESLQGKRVKLLCPGLPLSRQAALQMAINRTEKQVAELRRNKTQIEEDLGFEIPKEGTGISSDGTTPLRPASAGPTSWLAGPSPGCVKEEEDDSENEGTDNRRRSMSVSPTLNLLQKVASAGVESDQNQPCPTKKGLQKSSSIDSHEVSPPGPSQFDNAQLCSNETHRNRDRWSSAQNSPLSVPKPCQSTLLLNQSFNESLNCAETLIKSENTDVHSSRAISMIRDDCARTSMSSSNSSFIDRSSPPCYKQDAVRSGSSFQNSSRALLRHPDCIHLRPNNDTCSVKALDEIELILKKFSMGLKIRGELDAKINEIRAGLAKKSGTVVESSKTSFPATSCASSQNRFKTIVRSVSDDTLQASARGNAHQSLENTFQIETLLSRIESLEKEVRFQTNVNLEQRAKLQQIEDTSRTDKPLLDPRKNSGQGGMKNLEALVHELQTEKGQVSELVKELEQQLKFQANAHVDQFNKLKQTEAELMNYKTMMDVHRDKDAKEQGELKELIQSLRNEKEASDQLVKDLKGQLNDERMVRENAEKSVQDGQEALNAKQCRLELLQADFNSKLTLVTGLRVMVASAEDRSNKAENTLKEVKQQSESDLKLLTENLAELKVQVASANERSEKAEDALKTAKSKLQRSEAEVEKLVASAVAWNEKTEDLVKAAKTDLQKSEAEVNALKQKLAAFGDVKLEKDVAEECLRDARLMFESEEKKTKELSNEKVELESKIGQLQELCNSLKSDYSSMQQLFNELKNKDALNEKLKHQSSEESTKLQKVNSQLKRDNNGLRIENVALKNKADSLAATLEELSETLKNVTAFKITNETLLEKTKSQARSLHDLELGKSKAVETLGKLNAEHKTCLETIKGLTDQCELLQKEQTAAKKEKETNLANLRAEHDACKETIKLLMEKNTALEKRLSAVPEIEASAESVKSLWDKCDLMQKEREDLSKERADLANRLSESESRLTSLLAERDHIGDKVKSLSEQQNRLTATNARLEKEVDAKEKEFNTMKDNLSSSAADIENYVQSVKNVERQLGEAKKALDEKTSELERERTMHDEKIGQLKKQLTELQQSFDQKTSQFATEKTACTVEIQELKKQLKDCKQSLNEKTLQLTRERETTGQLEKQLAEARNTSEKKTSDLAGKIEQLERQLAELQKSLEGKTSELTWKNKNLERQLVDSQNSFVEKKTELEMERKLHKTKMESLMALNNTFQGHESPEKLVKCYKDQLITAEEELKQSMSDLKEAKRLLSKALRKVRNEKESSDTKSEKENINVILLAQDVSKMLLVEFERAEKLTSEVKVSTELLEYQKSELDMLKKSKAESVEMFETCMLDVEKLEAENVEREKLLGVQKTEVDKLKVENIEKQQLLGVQKSEMEKLKKSLRASQAKLELEQMFLRECRSSLEAEQKLLEETQSKLDVETKSLKDCRSKLAKEQTCLKEATTLNKILQKNVDDALKFMNDYKEKYQASEARFAELRLGPSSDYCTGSDASSGSSPVLDSGENMTQSIRTDESKALDLTVNRNLIKNTQAVGRSMLDPSMRNSGHLSNADVIEYKQRAHLVEELNKELTLVQNENHYLEHCLKDAEKESGECRTRCQELSELNLNLVKESGALRAKVEELLKRIVSDSEDKLCQESAMVTQDHENKAKGNDSALPSSCKGCMNLQEMLKESEERVHERNIMFQVELAKCTSEREEFKAKFTECDKVRLQLEKVKSTLEVKVQNVGEHDVIHCRLRLQGEQERTRQLNELLQREHEELEKCRKERDSLDAKVKEQTDIENQLQKDKQTLLMCVKEFQLETANEKKSTGKKKTGNDKRCASLDVQSTVKVEEWLQEQVGRHDTSPVKGDVGCDGCQKLQLSLSNLESEKEELVRSLAEMNQAYEQLAGLKKETDATEAIPVVVAEQDAGQRRTRAAVNLSKRLSKLDAALLSMRVKLDSMTEAKRKLEQSLAEALQTSATDRQKLEAAEDKYAFITDKLKTAQTDLAVKRNDMVQLQQNLQSEIDRSQMLMQSNNKLKTKLENKDYLIEDLALELKGTKSKLTQQTFDFTDAKTALQHKERIVTDLTYRLKMLCSNFSNMNVPRPQDVEDLKLYLKNMDTTPKAGAESSPKMKQLVDDYESSGDEMEEVRSVRISSPRNIQHVDENLHEKDVAEIKKHNRKLLELYNTQEKLIEHLVKEKQCLEEKASKEWQEQRVECLESENRKLRDELVTFQEVVSDLQEKARKREKESCVTHDRLTHSGDDVKLKELQITMRNLRGQLQVERLATKSLKDEKNALKEMLEKSEREVDHLRLRFLDLSKSECEQKMEYALLQGDAKLWTKEKGRFQEVLAVSKNEIKTLEAAVSTLHGTVDDLRKELGAERMGCATLKDEARAWTSERRQLMMDLEVAENERQKFQRQLEETAKQAKAEEGKMQESAQQVKALRESELELKRQMQVMEADVKDKSDRIVVYEEVLNQVKHYNVTNNLNRQLGIVRNEKQQVLKVLSEKEKEVALLNLDLKQQEASCKEALYTKENALLSLQSGIAVLTKQLNSSQSKAVGLLQMIQEKETEVRHVTKQFEAQVTKREETIALLEKKIKELEHNFEMLKNEHEIMNISKALDENLVAELRRDFEVMEHNVADLKFQNTELGMKKTELTDKNFKFIRKIEKLEKVVRVKDNIMEACKEQLMLMSNQLDIAYNHKDADGRGPDLAGLAMKQAQLNEREAKLVEKEMLEQKRLDTLSLKEKEIEKLKNALRNREADLEKREVTVATFEEEASSKVRDQLNGCLSELQTSRKEEYRALDEALKVRETRNKALDESLQVRERTVINKEADLVAREELLNGCHLEIQELAGAVTILEGDVETLKKNLYTKEASLETSKQTCVELENKLAVALDELLVEKQKRKLRSCVKTKSVKTMTDFDMSDAVATPVLVTEDNTVAKPAVAEPEASAIIPEIKVVKSTETQTMRDKFGTNFCGRCGIFLDQKSQEKTLEDPASKVESTGKALPSESQDCILQESCDKDEADPEVLMDADAYFVLTESLKDATVISQELCVANRQEDGTLTISPLKDLAFGRDVAVLRTVCEQAVLEEAVLKEKFEELRLSIAEMRLEIKDRESCTYKELDTIKELEDEMKQIIANLTGEIKALEAKLADAVKETPELKTAITALEKYLASERVAHGDMKAKYVNERNLNVWLEKQLQEARNEIELAKASSLEAEAVVLPGHTPTVNKEKMPTLANLLFPMSPIISSLRKRKHKSMKMMGESAKVARKSPSKSSKARPKSPARSRSPGRGASPRDGPRMKQVTEKMDGMEPVADEPAPEAETGSPNGEKSEQLLTVIKSKKDKTKKRMWYPCTICHKTFTDPFFFKNHLRCHERQQFFCTLCDKNFSNKRLYTSHLLMHEKVSVEPSPEYQCCVCKIECTSAIELKIHMIKHPALEDSMKPYKCRKCSRCFVLMTGLKAHSRVHKKGRKKFSPKKKRRRSTPVCGDLVLRPLDFEPIAQNIEVELKNPVIEIENLVVNSQVQAKKLMEELPGVTEELSGVTEELLGVTEELPGVTEELPEVTEELPGVTEELPAVTEELPGVTEELPGVTEELPGVTEELPGVTEELPRAKDNVEPKEQVGAMDLADEILGPQGKKVGPKLEKSISPVELNSVVPDELKLVSPVDLNSVSPVELTCEIAVEPVKVNPLETAVPVQSELVQLVPEVPAETEKLMDTEKTGPHDVRDKMELKCPHCPKICHFEFTYKRHLLVHSGTKEFVCTICDQAFTLKCNLAVHVKMRHRAEGVDPSDIVVKTAKKLAGKAKLKLQIKKLACDQCEEMFKFKKELKKHVREVHKLKGRKKEIEAVTYTCPVCEKKFYLQTKLVCHMETEHLISMDLNISSVETPVMIPPKCIPSPEQDTYLLSSPVSFKSAARKKQKLFSCPTCEKCFRKRKKLNQHMRVHILQQTLESPSTSVQESSELLLVSKEISTTQENLDMSFTSQGSSEVTLDSQETLDSLNSSSNVKKFGRTVCLSYCSDCGKAFPNRKMLSKHKRKHNLKKRWKKPSVLVTSSSDEKVEEGVSQDLLEVADVEKNVTNDAKIVEENDRCAPVELEKAADETEPVLWDLKSVVDPVETIPSPRARCTPVEMEKVAKETEPVLWDLKSVVDPVETVPSPRARCTPVEMEKAAKETEPVLWDLKSVVDPVETVPSPRARCTPVEMEKAAEETEPVLWDLKSVVDPVETVPSLRGEKSVSDCLKTVSADIGSAFDRLFKSDDNPSASAATTNITDASSNISDPPKTKKLVGVKKKGKSKSTVVGSVFDDKQGLLKADGNIVDNFSAAPLDVVDLVGPISDPQKALKSPSDKKKKKLTMKKKSTDPSLLTVVCHICGKRFLEKCNAMGHLKQVHDLVEVDIPKEILDGMRREYQCPTCPRKFSQKCSMQVHINKTHSGTDPESKVRVFKPKKKRSKKVLKSPSGGEKVKRKTSGNKELLSLLDGPNLEQAALEEKCRSADGMALKRPRKTLKIPEMNNDLYTCCFCGKDYVKFSRLESHITNCGAEKVSKKMKQEFEKFSPKAKSAPPVDQASSYALDYDTEAYDEDSSLDTPCTKLSPDDAVRKQGCNQFEQIEAHEQKLTPDASPVASQRPSSVASGGSIRSTPNVSPTGSKRASNFSPSNSRKCAPSASPARPKSKKSGTSRKGRSPGRKPKKTRPSAAPVCCSSPERRAVTSLHFKTRQDPDGGAQDVLSNTSKDFLPDTPRGTAQVKIVSKYTPTYSDISDEEDDIPLNRFSKAVSSQESLNTSREKSKKCTPKNVAALRISPRRRSWDVGQTFLDTAIVPSRQISRALTFSNQEQTKVRPDSELDNEPNYKSYSQTLKTFERQRHCSDDGKVNRKSRWDQPQAPSVSEKPALSVYDFNDDDIEVQVPPVKKTELKLSGSGDKTTLSSSHSKPEVSDTKKKSSSSGKSSKIHRKKSKHARWSSPKSKKKSPKVVAAEPNDVPISASTVPNFALSNFSPKRKTDYPNTYNQCDRGAAFQTSRGGPKYYDSAMNSLAKPHQTTTADPSAAKYSPGSFSLSSICSSTTPNIHSESGLFRPYLARPVNASRDTSMHKDSATFHIQPHSAMCLPSASRHFNTPQDERQMDNSAFSFTSNSSMFGSKPAGHFNDPDRQTDSVVSGACSDSVTYDSNAERNLTESPVLQNYDVALDLTKNAGATSTDRAATPPVSIPKTDSSTSGGRFKCFHCGETFKFHSLYSRHLKKEHKVGRQPMDWSL